MKKLLSIRAFFTGWLADVHWPLLVFLLLFLQVKMWVKLLGLLWGGWYYWKNRSRTVPFFKTPLPFYAGMAGIAVLNLFCWQLYRSPHYLPLLGIGIGFWGMAAMAFLYLYTTVKKEAAGKTARALWIFFLLNAAVSCLQLLCIMWRIGELNPYRYQGNYQEFFISTGDYIHGITFDTSTTNALINAFAVLYFLHKQKLAETLFCMLALLLTGSNFTNLLLLGCLLYLFVFRSSRVQKSVMVVLLCMGVNFLTQVSPQNNNYAINLSGKLFGKDIKPKYKLYADLPITQRPDSTLTPEEKRQKFAQQWLDSMAALRAMAAKAGDIKKTGAIPVKDSSGVLHPVIPKVNIHAPEFQHRPDSSAARLQALSYLQTMEQEGKSLPAADTPSRKNLVPGKIKAFQQLGQYLVQHPSRIITGTGMGNFSSKLAFRATGLQIAGGYPGSLRYVNDDFKTHNLAIYLAYFGKDSGYHSMAHSPNSFYAQLLSEYGLLGVLLFLFFYVRPFAKKKYIQRYGLSLCLLVSGALVTEYWFEQLSVMVLFELLLLLNEKESAEENHA